VEIQALTTFNNYGQVRRTANGIDFNRLLVVAAVLSRRVGLKLSSQDIIVNVTGGLKVGEPAADLGIALAIASSFKDVEVVKETAAIGEVGLSGELRPAAQMDRRLAEVARLGFTKCIIPKTNAKLKPPPKLELIIAGTLREAIYKGLVAGGKKAGAKEEDDDGGG
jgi:DNA repair protein RadA/Sms